MILQATVATNSTADPEKKGRVRITAPGIWAEPDGQEDYFPVVNNTPLNVGDIVFVYVESMTSISNALVLGKRRDNNFQSNGDKPDGFDVLWESVSGDGDDKVWSVLYVCGDIVYFQNSSDVAFTVSAGEIELVVSDKYSLSIDKDGNTQYSTKGTIEVLASGQSAAQPVPFGDTLKQQLETLTKRVDAIIQAGKDAFNAGVSGASPQDGGVKALGEAGGKWGEVTSAAQKESWSEILNKSVTTAGDK